MNIGIVTGVLSEQDQIEPLKYYITQLPPDTKVFTTTAVPEGSRIVMRYACAVSGLKLTEVSADKSVHGSDWGFQTNVLLAKQIDQLTAFWDYKHEVPMNAISAAGIWGKKIHVNPHDNGGIVSNLGTRRVAQQVEASASNPESEGSNPSAPTI